MDREDPKSNSLLKEQSPRIEPKEPNQTERPPFIIPELNLNIHESQFIEKVQDYLKQKKNVCMNGRPAQFLCASKQCKNPVAICKEVGQCKCMQLHSVETCSLIPIDQIKKAIQKKMIGSDPLVKHIFDDLEVLRKQITHIKDNLVHFGLSKKETLLMRSLNQSDQAFTLTQLNSQDIGQIYNNTKKDSETLKLEAMREIQQIILKELNQSFEKFNSSLISKIEKSVIILSVSKRQEEQIEQFSEVKCIGENKCVNICMNEKCQQHAIICGVEDCKCQVNHQEKNICPRILPKKLTHSVIAKINKTPDIIPHMNQALTNLIKWLQDYKVRIEKPLKEMSLSQIEIWFRQVLQNKSYKELTGKRFYQLKQMVNNLNVKQRNLKTQQFIKKYWDKKSRQFQQELGQMQKKFQQKDFESQKIDQQLKQTFQQRYNQSERQRLKRQQEISQLKETINKLMKEKQLLQKIQNDQKVEKANLLKQIKDIKQIKNQISNEKALLQQKYHKIELQKNKISKEKLQLQNNKNRLLKEKSQLSQNQNQLKIDFEKLQDEKQQLKEQYNQEKLQKNKIQKIQQKLLKEKAQLEKNKKKLQKEKSQLQQKLIQKCNQERKDKQIEARQKAENKKYLTSLYQKIDHQKFEKQRVQKLYQTQRQTFRLLQNFYKEIKCKQGINVIQIDDKLFGLQPIKYNNLELRSLVIQKKADLKAIQQLLKDNLFFKNTQTQKHISVKSLNLLYRASQYNFNTDFFHQKCDGIPHTLLLLKNEFNKIIGAYTPIKWKQSGWLGQGYDYQKTNSSFLFSLTNKDKIKLSLTKDFNKTVEHDSNYGPIFGSGNDLCIKNQTDKVQSHAKIGNSYTNERYSNDPIVASQQFSGGQRFKILEWQIFQVVYNTE